MASRKPLIEITYHDDDDTGMYKVGEIDFGVYGTFEEYVRHYREQGVKDIVSVLSHLIWHVIEHGYRITRQNPTEGIDGGSKS